jgi:hypothetical protein
MKKNNKVSNLLDSVEGPHNKNSYLYTTILHRSVGEQIYPQVKKMNNLTFWIEPTLRSNKSYEMNHAINSYLYYYTQLFCRWTNLPEIKKMNKCNILNRTNPKI